MRSKVLDPEKFIDDALRSVARKNNARSYGTWLNEKRLDPNIKAVSDMTAANTAYALRNRDIKKDTSISNTGYAKYLTDKSKASLLKDLSGAKQELERAKQISLDGYRKYVEEIDNDRNELVKSTFKRLIELGITEVDEAYRRAKAAGLSDADAKAVAKDTTSISRTDLYRKAISAVISKSYTYVQAKAYADSLGLPKEDSLEIGRIANILNHVQSNHYYYSGEYRQYIDSLLNTQK
jgi:phytoene dehydrogenase-like protein